MSGIHPVSDRLAIIDLINRYVDAIDAKRWDQLEDFFTEDAIVWWNPESSTTGRGPVLERMRQMLGTDEIVTYHHVASFTPSISGDAAEASVRIRAMHHGLGSRAGRFWESLAVQTTSFVRTPAGWRCPGFSWQVVVGLGSMDLFDGLRPGGPPPTHGWPEVYEKFEFASPEWVDMLRGLISERLAGQDLSGVEFVLCEEYTHPPQHLRRPGSDSDRLPHPSGDRQGPGHQRGPRRGGVDQKDDLRLRMGQEVRHALPRPEASRSADGGRADAGGRRGRHVEASRLLAQVGHDQPDQAANRLVTVPRERFSTGSR